VLALTGAAVGGATYGVERVLPAEDEVARGVWFDGEQLGAGVDAAAVAAAHAEELLARRLVLRPPAGLGHGDDELLHATLGELGVEIDVDRAAAELRAVARRGDLQDRLDEAWQARQGRVAVSLPFALPLEPIAERLVAAKERLDRKATPARWDFAAQAPKSHADGVLLDLAAAVAAIAEAAGSGDIDIEVPVVTVTPSATTAVVAAMDRATLVSRFETVFGYGGNQTGRAQNIARAAAGIDGMVMMPGEIVSFNDQVGPRSEDNGFAEAGEIYKGEMRIGIGGGTCQVASTFHAASYFGGLEVVERSPHSRPSGYIRMGLDATVAYPTVDLKLKNPLPFPVLVHAHIANGGTLVVEIFGHEKPAEVSFHAATIGIQSYKREVREASWLAEGTVIKKQGGRQGVTIEKTRTITAKDGTVRVEKTQDNYPPTKEIYYVAPGTDVAEALPPLPDESQG
jgi:vancomycin resistance protein YoaR